MATDSTHLQLGETGIGTGSDMALGWSAPENVQLAAVADAPVQVEFPQGEGLQMIVIPVKPGQVISLPTDSPDGLLAKLGADGNLAVVVDGRTVILKGYAEANQEAPIRIVTSDGDAVDVADVLAGTLPELDIQTAAGPAAGPQGSTIPGSGIFVPFGAGPLLPAFLAEGVLDPTALKYKIIDDERKLFVRIEEDTDTVPAGFTIQRAIVNEDDLLGSRSTERYDKEEGVPEFIKVFGDKGNDSFDAKDIDDGDDDVPDTDRESLLVTAILTVDFAGKAPGKLLLDTSLLPSGLTSGGGPIVYEILPAGGGSGQRVVGFVDEGDGKFGPGDRVVFRVEVAEETSGGTFNLLFSLFDNFDNEAPVSLLGANEQDLALLFKITAEDSNGTQTTGTWNVGVRDDIPFFGEVEVHDDHFVIHPSPDSFVLDETLGGDPDADDMPGAPWNGEAVLIVNSYLPQIISMAEEAAQKAGIILDPSSIAKYEHIADDFLNAGGIAVKQLLVSFGADGGSQEFLKAADDPLARDSVFGALSGSGENEHPFELFMMKSGTGATSADGDATAADQPTNATAIWEGVEYPIVLTQHSAQFIVGYIEPSGAAAGYKLPVFMMIITDLGQVSFIQLLPIAHEIDGATPADHDDTFTILGADGVTQLIQVRATDYDGDHAILPLTVAFQDDGPKITSLTFTPSIIDEDHLPGGIPGGPGDVGVDVGVVINGKVTTHWGSDNAGSMSIVQVMVSGAGLPAVAIDDLRTADGHAITITRETDTITGIVTWAAVVADGPNAGDPVFTLTLNGTGPNIGELSFVLHAPLQHPSTDLDAQNDGPETALEDNLIFQVTFRATDGDGDSDVQSSTFALDDDSPSIVLNYSASFLLGVDETVDPASGGKAAGDIDANGLNGTPQDGLVPEGDETLNAAVVAAAGLDALGTVIGAGGSSAANLFIGAAGADGEKSHSYDLDIVGSGLTALRDTATNGLIELVEDGGFIKGVVQGTGELVFALHIDEQTGDVTMAQYRTINHGSDYPDSYPDEVISLGSDLLQVTYSITDADRDSVTAARDIGSAITFEDDGPTAVDETDSVSEDDALVATGNVIDGKDGGNVGFGTDDNDTDGVADTLGSDDFGSIAWTGVSGGVIEGAYGKLYVDSDGNYRYELDNSKVQGLDDGDTEIETFTYTVVDGDGDEDVATLTITINGTDEPDPATGKLNVAGCVFEDLQPNQFEGNSTSFPEALAILFTPSDNETVTGAFLNIPTGWQVQVWDVGGATEVALLNADPTADISSHIDNILAGTYQLRPIPPADGDVDASFSLALHIQDPESGLTNILTDTFTVFVDAVADKPTNVTISVTDNGDGDKDNLPDNQQFGKDETGTVSVTANFSDTDESEVHTVTLDLGSTEFQFDDPNVAGISYTSDGTGSFTYLYNGIPYQIDFEIADGKMTLTLPAEIESFAKTFDIAYTQTDTVDAAEFVLTAKADENPATDGGCGPNDADLDDEGQAGDNDAEVSVSPLLPNILNGDFITNTNVQEQLALVSFVDVQDPLRAFARIIVRGSQGQQGAILADAGFLIDALHEHLVSLEATAGTKVIVTDFSLEGVVIVDQGNAQLEVNDKDDGSTEATGLVQLITPGTEGGTIQPFEYSDDDASSGGHTVAEPDAGASGADYVFGGSGADTINGVSGPNVLNGGDILNAANNGADTINGGSGTDLLVFDPLDTLNGNAGFDIVRVDAGAIYNTMTAEALTLPAGLTSATVDMRNAKISNVESILITEENAASGAVGTKLILNASDVIDFTDSSKDADNVEADTLYIIGSKGDSLELHLDAGVTIGSQSLINDMARGMTFTQYNLSNGGHLVVDTDVTVTAVT